MQHSKATPKNTEHSLQTPLPDNKSNLFKTEMCRNWTEMGQCRYGRKCRFAHGLDELRTVQRHARYKTEICKTYHLTGTCLYGVRCTFVHEENLYKTTLKDAPPKKKTLPRYKPSPLSLFEDASSLSPSEMILEDASSSQSSSAQSSPSLHGFSKIQDSKIKETPQPFFSLSVNAYATAEPTPPHVSGFLSQHAWHPTYRLSRDLLYPVASNKDKSTANPTALERIWSFEQPSTMSYPLFLHNPPPLETEPCALENSPYTYNRDTLDPLNPLADLDSLAALDPLNPMHNLTALTLDNEVADQQQQYLSEDLFSFFTLSA